MNNKVQLYKEQHALQVRLASPPVNVYKTPHNTRHHFGETIYNFQLICHKT